VKPANADDKVAIVTVASRGIGRGIALGLGEARWTVYVTGRTLVAALVADPRVIEKTGQALTSRSSRATTE
jgi:NAD(P)-dependent dehydrogenase (short-subunit alcohol dehydrogenase family)